MMDEPSWLTLARKYIGTREIPGEQTNAHIARWWGAIKSTIRDDETPWCAGFVGGVLEEAGFRSSRNPAARSYMSWGYRLEMPALGAIIVLSRGSLNAWSGHVGFVVGKDERGRMMVLGGNQGDKVSIAPFTADRLLGYRWPPSPTEVPRDFAVLPLYDAAGQPASTDEQ